MILGAIHLLFSIPIVALLLWALWSLITIGGFKSGKLIVDRKNTPYAYIFFLVISLGGIVVLVAGGIDNVLNTDWTKLYGGPCGRYCR